MSNRNKRNRAVSIEATSRVPVTYVVRRSKSIDSDALEICYELTTPVRKGITERSLNSLAKWIRKKNESENAIPHLADLIDKLVSENGSKGWRLQLVRCDKARRETYEDMVRNERLFFFVLDWRDQLPSDQLRNILQTWGQHTLQARGFIEVRNKRRLLMARIPIDKPISQPLACKLASLMPGAPAIGAIKSIISKHSRGDVND